jgi:hypothetical protein
MAELRVWFAELARLDAAEADYKSCCEDRAALQARVAELERLLLLANSAGDSHDG